MQDPLWNGVVLCEVCPKRFKTEIVFTKIEMII